MDKRLAIDITRKAIEEDLSDGDITSKLTIPENYIVHFSVSNRDDIILCGVDFVDLVFEEVARFLKINHDVKYVKNYKDGDLIKAGSKIITGSGNGRLVFASERIILNIMQFASAISTEVGRFSELIHNKNVKILDTRKTIIGLRHLQKYAVKIGGGENHRFSLGDMILIKDNHIEACGGVKNAIMSCNGKFIEIECDRIEQVREAIELGVDIIMLDNMNLEQMQEAIGVIRSSTKKTKIEVSGGVGLHNIEKISKLDIDYISIGSITSSVKNVDIGLDLV